MALKLGNGSLGKIPGRKKVKLGEDAPERKGGAPSLPGDEAVPCIPRADSTPMPIRYGPITPTVRVREASALEQPPQNLGEHKPTIRYGPKIPGSLTGNVRIFEAFSSKAPIQ